MKKNRNLLLLIAGFMAILFLIVFLTSCNDEETTIDDAQKTVKIDKHAAIEIKINQKHLDSITIIETNKCFYDNAGKLILNKITYDTVTSLGMIKDTLDTGKTFEDENGDTQPIDTVIIHKKNYQFFITAK